MQTLKLTGFHQGFCSCSVQQICFSVKISEELPNKPKIIFCQMFLESHFYASGIIWQRSIIGKILPLPRLPTNSLKILINFLATKGRSMDILAAIEVHKNLSESKTTLLNDMKDLWKSQLFNIF